LRNLVQPVNPIAGAVLRRRLKMTGCAFHLLLRTSSAKLPRVTRAFHHSGFQRRNHRGWLEIIGASHTVTESGSEEQTMNQEFR
jgi:hypothetical protein